jgi:stress-induced-phosphoprotein 1
VEKVLTNPQNITNELATCPCDKLKEALCELFGLPETETFGSVAKETKKQEVKQNADKKTTSCSKLTKEEEEAEQFKQTANALYKEKKFNEALEMYDKAIELNPKNLIYLNNKAGRVKKILSNYI